MNFNRLDTTTITFRCEGCGKRFDHTQATTICVWKSHGPEQALVCSEECRLETYMRPVEEECDKDY